MTAPPTLILASASPRRADLLRQLGLSFRQQPCTREEPDPAGASPAAHALETARGKARAIAGEQGGNHPVILLAADTVVHLDGQIMGKPRDAGEAARMLRSLSGRRHQVYSGVCILAPDGRELTDCSCTEVTFGPLSPADIQWYIESGEPMDKAGAYGIQGLAARFVERVEGCYYNVVGLPLFLVTGMLRDAGFDPNQPIALPR